MPSTIMMLPQHGDLKIEWTEATHDEVVKAIQAKMDQGVAFYILDPESKAKTPPIVQIDSTDAATNRQVYVRDPDIKNLVESGFASIASFAGVAELKTVARAKTAEEAAQTDTVAVPPKKGG